MSVFPVASANFVRSLRLKSCFLDFFFFLVLFCFFLFLLELFFFRLLSSSEEESSSLVELVPLEESSSLSSLESDSSDVDEALRRWLFFLFFRFELFLFFFFFRCRVFSFLEKSESHSDSLWSLDFRLLDSAIALRTSSSKRFKLSFFEDFSTTLPVLLLTFSFFSSAILSSLMATMLDDGWPEEDPNLIFLWLSLEANPSFEFFPSSLEHFSSPDGLFRSSLDLSFSLIFAPSTPAKFSACLARACRSDSGSSRSDLSLPSCSVFSLDFLSVLRLMLIFFEEKGSSW